MLLTNCFCSCCRPLRKRLISSWCPSCSCFAFSCPRSPNNDVRSVKVKPSSATVHTKHPKQNNAPSRRRFGLGRRLLRRFSKIRTIAPAPRREKHVVERSPKRPPRYGPRANGTTLHTACLVTSPWRDTDMQRLDAESVSRKVIVPPCRFPSQHSKTRNLFCDQKPNAEHRPHPSKERTTTAPLFWMFTGTDPTNERTNEQTKRRTNTTTTKEAHFQFSNKRERENPHAEVSHLVLRCYLSLLAIHRGYLKRPRHVVCGRHCNIYIKNNTV